MFAVISLGSVRFFTWTGAEQMRPQVGMWLVLHRLGLYTLQPEMVEVVASSFMMGSPDPKGPQADPDARDDEYPQHKVEIKHPFKIGKYEVTFDEYEVFVRSTGYEGGRSPGDQGWGRGQRPVINVSWEDAVAYADWLSEQTHKHYRLPSEAEWEYAARAGTVGRYWWCEETEPNCDVKQGYANCNGCGREYEYDKDRTAEVGSFKPNKFGLQDTSGNVWEWVRDCWHDNYSGQDMPVDGSAWEEKGDSNCERSLRGGSWSSRPGSVRSADRDGNTPSKRDNFIGFRVAQDF